MAYSADRVVLGVQSSSPSFNDHGGGLAEGSIGTEQLFDGVLVGDLDGDGSIGVADVVQLLDEWGAGEAEADLNLDGSVDGKDLLLLIESWE